MGSVVDDMFGSVAKDVTVEAWGSRTMEEANADMAFKMKILQISTMDEWKETLKEIVNPYVRMQLCLKDIHFPIPKQALLKNVEDNLRPYLALMALMRRILLPDSPVEKRLEETVGLAATIDTLVNSLISTMKGDSTEEANPKTEEKH